MNTNPWFMLLGWPHLIALNALQNKKRCWPQLLSAQCHLLMDTLTCACMWVPHEKAEILTVWWMFPVTSTSVAASKTRDILLKILRCLTCLHLFLNFKFCLKCFIADCVYSKWLCVLQVILMAIINSFWAIYLNALDIFFILEALSGAISTLWFDKV